MAETREESRIEQAARAVFLDLVVRHHNAASRLDRLEREFLFGLTVDLERAYPFLAQARQPDA